MSVTFDPLVVLKLWNTCVGWPDESTFGNHGCCVLEAEEEKDHLAAVMVWVSDSVRDIWNLNICKGTISAVFPFYTRS